MLCTYCGRQNPSERKDFCFACGKPLSLRCLSLVGSVDVAKASLELRIRDDNAVNGELRIDGGSQELHLVGSLNGAKLSLRSFGGGSLAGTLAGLNYSGTFLADDASVSSAFQFTVLQKNYFESEHNTSSHLPSENSRLHRPREFSVRDSGSPAKLASLISTIAVVVGFSDLPYGYYMVLRLVLCGVSLFLAFGVRLHLDDWQRWVLGGFVVLYNPVLPIRIGEKGIWEVVNIVTVIFFWFLSRREGGTILQWWSGTSSNRSSPSGGSGRRSDDEPSYRGGFDDHDDGDDGGDGG